VQVRYGLVLAAALVAAAGRPAVSGGETGVPPSPLGKRLPPVVGHALDGTEVRLPEDLAGGPAVLLVAYRRQTQRDVDRWRDLVERELPALRWLEVPTIANPVWRPLAGWIDGGMRGGVPRELWGKVVTLYRDAPELRAFLGDRGGYTTHVVLVDAAGVVAWFDAGGFTEDGAGGLLRAATALGAGIGAERSAVDPRPPGSG
jgi:hypothetical protein